MDIIVLLYGYRRREEVFEFFEFWQPRSILAERASSDLIADVKNDYTGEKIDQLI